MTLASVSACGSCGADNPRNLLYCGKCWAPLSFEAPAAGRRAGPDGTRPAEPAGRQRGRAEECVACGRDNPDGLLYCASCRAPLALPRGHLPEARPAPDAPYGRNERAGMLAGAAAALAVAVFVRFYALGNIPPGLQPGEEVFRLAASAVRDHGWIAFWSDSTLGQPPGLAYLTAGWGGLLGDSAMLLRMLPAAVGLAAVGVLFLFCRALFGPRAAALAALLMAFSVWHIGYSRLLVPVSMVPLVASLTAYLLYMAFQEKREARRHRWLLAAAGLSFGVGLYLHNSFLVLTVALLALWARELIAGELPMGVVLRRSLLFMVPAVVAALPFAIALAGDVGSFNDRVMGAAVSRAPEYRELGGVAEKARYVMGRLGSGVGTLWWRRGAGGGESAGSPNRLLDPVTALLAAVGALVALRNWRDRRYFLLLTMLGAGVATAGLTTDAGVYGRLGVALPAVFALAGLSLHWGLVWMRGRVPDPQALAVVGALLAIVATHNVVSYYRHPAGQDGTLSAGAFHGMLGPSGGGGVSNGARPTGPEVQRPWPS